jgi:hypothetical protein
MFTKVFKKEGHKIMHMDSLLGIDELVAKYFLLKMKIKISNLSQANN